MSQSDVDPMGRCVHCGQRVVTTNGCDCRQNRIITPAQAAANPNVPIIGQKAPELPRAMMVQTPDGTQTRYIKESLVSDVLVKLKTELLKAVEELEAEAAQDIFTDAPECEDHIASFFARLAYVKHLAVGGAPPPPPSPPRLTQIEEE